MMQSKVIRLPLITHVAKTNNKYAADKMFKINNQALYSQSLNRYARAIVIDNMHKHILKYIDVDRKIKKVHHLIYKFGTVINHDTVRIYKGKVSWKKPDIDYVPRWDANNLSDVWVKAGNDAIVMSGLLDDDNVSIVNPTTYYFTFVDDLADAFLEITLNYYE